MSSVSLDGRDFELNEDPTFEISSVWRALFRLRLSAADVCWLSEKAAGVASVHVAVKVPPAVARARAMVFGLVLRPGVNDLTLQGTEPIQWEEF